MIRSTVEIRFHRRVIWLADLLHGQDEELVAERSERVESMSMTRCRLGFGAAAGMGLRKPMGFAHAGEDHPGPAPVTQTSSALVKPRPARVLHTPVLSGGIVLEDQRQGGQTIGVPAGYTLLAATAAAKGVVPDDPGAGHAE
jgi:hypothetical protein